MTDRELITRRLDMARETMLDARRLADSGASGRSIINRAYYSMFYSVLALANLRGFPTRKHQGAIAFFDREFVRTEVLSKELSASLHEAFDLRLEADYAELSQPTEDEVLGVLQGAEAFTTAIEAYLRRQLADL